MSHFNRNNEQFHEVVHWRRVKEVLNLIFDYNKYDNNFRKTVDLNKIVAYEALGEDLQGEDTIIHTESGRSCWVSNNRYEVFEIPYKTSKEQNNYEGHFLVLAHNSDFNYWVFGELIYSILYRKTKENMKLCQKVEFYPVGVYDIIAGNNRFAISLKSPGKKAEYGFSRFKNTFDRVGGRLVAYGTSSTDILAKILHIRQNSQKLIDTKKVEIYKPRNKNTKALYYSNKNSKALPRPNKKI